MRSTCEGVKTSEAYHDAFPYFSLSVDLKTSNFQSQITQCDFPVSNMHVAACAIPAHQRYFPAQTLLVSNEAYVVKTTLNTETRLTFTTVPQSSEGHYHVDTTGATSK